MKMTREELFKFGLGLSSVLGLRGVKFSFAVAKNLRKINKEIKDIKEALAPDEDYLLYDKERAGLAKKFAKKDEQGVEMKEAVPELGGERYIVENQSAFEDAINGLKEVHAEAVAVQDLKIEKYKDSLLEEIDFEIHKISMDEVPENITPAQMEAIHLMIFEEES
jgi:hypothetical protein